MITNDGDAAIGSEDELDAVATGDGAWTDVRAETDVGVEAAVVDLCVTKDVTVSTSSTVFVCVRNAVVVLVTVEAPRLDAFAAFSASIRTWSTRYQPLFAI